MTPTQKGLWTILFCLFVVLIGQLLISSNYFVSADNPRNSQKIAGSNANLPKPVKETLVSPPEKSSGTEDPQIYAKSVILVDVASSYVMFAKNSDEKVPIASTTKIMTALVILEDYSDKLNDVVTITYPMIAVEGSDIQLGVGEKITVENLLKGLLIMSGNDTAFALASYFGGKDAFVAKMNKKAVFLGLNDLEYKDPAGLDEGNSSNAHDLAILASYAIRNQKFHEIVSTPEITISSVDVAITHDLKSSNRMLRNEETYYLSYAIGIKTGFTNEAGHCLVSAAQKDGHVILGVILNTNENSIYASARESKKLLEWGFANWTWQ